MKFQVIEWSFLGTLKCHPIGSLLVVRLLPPQEPISCPGPAPGSVHLRVAALFLAHWKGETQLFPTSIFFTMGPSTFSAPSKFKYFQNSKRQIVQLTNISLSSSTISFTVSLPQLPRHCLLLFLFQWIVCLYRVLHALSFHFSSYLLVIHHPFVTASGSLSFLSLSSWPLCWHITLCSITV